MRRRAGLIGDWLIAIGAVGLFVSLLLTWSHQFSPRLLALPGARVALRGVPADPTGWQVYSIADALLAALAVALVLAALIGGRRFRLVVLPFIAVAIAFVVHAMSKPPTNGVRSVNPAAVVPQYLPIAPTAGVGETVALVSLGLAVAGVAISLFSD
jgi:hypothetical protein